MDAEKKFSLEYNSLYRYLLTYKKSLSNRNKSETGIRYEWYVLQRYGPSYFEDFKKPKIIWLELTDSNKFAFSEKEDYILAGAFMMTGESLKYLLAFLNSKLCLFHFSLICNSSGMDTIQWKKFSLEKLPIKKLSKPEQQPFISLVDKILAITKSPDYLENQDKQAKVKEYEKQIDQLVYRLYELTPEEIDIVEEKKDAETEYLNFMKQFKKLDSEKAKKALVKSISEEDLDLIFEGLDEYREGHPVSEKEEVFIREFKRLASE